MKLNTNTESGEFASFERAVSNIDVFDTHSHLIGGRLAARDFWEIGEYFWLREEMIGAGYPADPDSLGEADRCEAYARAFAATRNTSMNWVVRRIMGDLYGLEITDAASVRKANEAVGGTAEREGWAAEVTGRLNIRRIAVNREEHAPFPELPEGGVWLPRLDDVLTARMEEFAGGGARAGRVEAAAEELSELVDEAARKGAPGIMTTLPRLDRRIGRESVSLRPEDNSAGEILDFLLHRMCARAERNGLFVQFFLGIERNRAGGRPAPVNDPERILNLYGLFEAYACPFELVLGSEINNLDAVQAARIFPHVRVGGLWWYNFRVSSYRDCMQKRFEALPPAKSSFVVSDARCVEWCYGKILLIRKLMAEFLFAQVQNGWVDEEEALRCAREWLHDAAARLYLK